MRFARGFLIFNYGLFTIAAQTLLFREFITTLEGNDIGVGIFFACWFLWVGLGALIVNKAQALADKLLQHIELLLLGYLPAFILQALLIIQARELAGVESYALLPIKVCVVWSIVLNAPVSVITGMLFPLACRWVKQDQSLPVSRVYIIEAAGSFLGGLGVTVLLGFGVSPAKIFFVLALIVSSSVFIVPLAKMLSRDAATSRLYTSVSCAVSFLVLASALGCLYAGADKSLMRYVRAKKWTKLLPREALTGSFQTAQAEYLYGTYQGQWVAVREGSVCEALPDESAAGRIAAIGLCQKPDAARILVVGSGLSLCYAFLNLPQIEQVTWVSPDSEYVQQVDNFVPQKLKLGDERLQRPTGDIRLLLAERKQYYDLAILNLPEATSSVLNRYYTLEFYHQIKSSLSPGGALVVRIPGGENILGTELANLGASTKLTLEEAPFSRLIVAPGEDTWFIASDSEAVTGEPGTLRDRFAAIKGAAQILPPDALLSVYLPDRAAAALETYSAADLPKELLINRDSRPMTHLYSLLLAAKQSDAPVTRLVKHLSVAGPLAFIIPIVIFVALRILYVLKSPHQGNPSSFDSTFLVFSAGSLGIGVVIVLMYLYQTHFGSLYLHIGVISSLFMIGLTVGASSISYFVTRPSCHPARAVGYLFAVLSVHTMILATVAFWPAEQWTHPTFAIAFVLCGLCTGCYFPLGAKQLADANFEAGQAGSKLEMADHIGASVGGLLAGLALVPVLGTRQTLFVFALLILANLPTAAIRFLKRQKLPRLAVPALGLRRLGYVLFGVGLSVVLCSNLLAEAGSRLRPALPRNSAQALASELRIEQEQADVHDGQREINYFRVYDPNNKLTGYVFSSQDLAPEVRGFGGRMNLAIYVDTAGRLIKFHILRSSETPSYLALLNRLDANGLSWPDCLDGHQLFEPEPFADVDAVSGATVSCDAILSALEKSGHGFATQILGYTLRPEVGGKAHHADYMRSAAAIYLVGAFVLTLVVIYRGGFWTRLAVLVLNLVVGGFWLNAQYSSEQIAGILSFQAGAVGLTSAFLLVVIVPLLVVLFGNFYCGYLCPFGAVQELLSYIVPTRLKPRISVEQMKNARFIKYLVLFVLIIVFFLARDRTTLAADPLIGVFSRSISFYTLSLVSIVVIALAASIFYTRFWCRYLCPVGAFLSLFNNVVLLKRYVPVKKFGKCEFGVTFKDQMDCIYCDRCRYEPKAARTEGAVLPASCERAKPLSRHFAVGVFVIAIIVSAVSVDRFLQVIPTGLGQPTIAVSSGGQPRDVDLQRIRTMIRQNRLSDREAEFYKKAD